MIQHANGPAQHVFAEADARGINKKSEGWSRLHNGPACLIVRLGEPRAVADPGNILPRELHRSDALHEGIDLKQQGRCQHTDAVMNVSDIIANPGVDAVVLW
ncbi:hypothetical protein PBRA_001868 [Plasmodiophora brassicae]|uniref:Uncharacterized protein n=1 Tax=Plasmodiophora brassicae TaxID=37360 RepID=A0A0G4J191_PLABS|nr:hypothetical protein PBRA_001868 [Plasmodiophora brassicae]